MQTSTPNQSAAQSTDIQDPRVLPTVHSEQGGNEESVKDALSIAVDNGTPSNTTSALSPKVVGAEPTRHGASNGTAIGADGPSVTTPNRRDPGTDSDGPVITEVEADIHPTSPESACMLRSRSAKRPPPPSSESSPSPTKSEKRKMKKERKKANRLRSGVFSQ